MWFILFSCYGSCWFLHPMHLSHFLVEKWTLPPDKTELISSVPFSINSNSITFGFTDWNTTWCWFSNPIYHIFAVVLPSCKCSPDNLCEMVLNPDSFLLLWPLFHGKPAWFFLISGWIFSTSASLQISLYLLLWMVPHKYCKDCKTVHSQMLTFLQGIILQWYCRFVPKNCCRLWWSYWTYF